jgi:hypothetical protein
LDEEMVGMYQQSRKEDGHYDHLRLAM